MGAPAAAAATAPEQGAEGGAAQSPARSGAVTSPAASNRPADSGMYADLRRLSVGLTMLDSIVDAAKLKHVSSKDDLEQAFRKREVAVTALKAKMSKVRCRTQGPLGLHGGCAAATACSPKTCLCVNAGLAGEVGMDRPHADMRQAVAQTGCVPHSAVRPRAPFRTGRQSTGPTQSCPPRPSRATACARPSWSLRP